MDSAGPPNLSAPVTIHWKAQVVHEPTRQVMMAGEKISSVFWGERRKRPLHSRVFTHNSVNDKHYFSYRQSIFAIILTFIFNNRPKEGKFVFFACQHYGSINIQLILLYFIRFDMNKCNYLAMGPQTCASKRSFVCSTHQDLAIVVPDLCNDANRHE